MHNENNDYLHQFMNTIFKTVTSSMNLQTKNLIGTETLSQYNKVVQGLSLKVLMNIQTLLNKENGEMNLMAIIEKGGIGEAFNHLLDVNDHVLNKSDQLLEDLYNPSANKSSNVIVEYVNNSNRKIRLLSSVQVERPQIKFFMKPNNSQTPFRPILKCKPHALVPLEEYEDGDLETYPHPYGYELNMLELSKEYVTVPEILLAPQFLEDNQFEYIDTEDALRRAIDEIKCVNEVAVGIGHHSVRSYLGITCIVQLSTRTKDYIIDSLVLHGKLDVLNEITADSEIVKVFYGANDDLLRLQRDFGVYVVNMFDIGHGCIALGRFNESLRSILTTYCDNAADADHITLIDWRLRPLSPQMVRQARTSTHFLLYIHDRLKIELRDHSLIAHIFLTCKQLCQRLYYKPRLTSQHCTKVYEKSTKQFSASQMVALHKLLSLRDSIAREEDESPAFVLSTAMLLTMAESLPRDADSVLACCTQTWKLPLLRKYVFDFVRVCGEARQEECNEVRPRRSNVLEWLVSASSREVIESNKTRVHTTALAIDGDITEL